MYVNVNVYIYIYKYIIYVCVRVYVYVYGAPTALRLQLEQEHATSASDECFSSANNSQPRGWSVRDTRLQLCSLRGCPHCDPLYIYIYIYIYVHICIYNKYTIYMITQALYVFIDQ